MGAYFDALDTGRFAQFLTDDVTWPTTADHHRTQGREAVQEAIGALHARPRDMQTVRVVFAPDAAYLEGSAAGPGGRGRIPYCVAYDVIEGRIAAMRAYGALTEERPAVG